MLRLFIKNIIPLLVFILVINIFAFASSVPVIQPLNTWYMHLEKSCLTPPNWVFAPIWTVLYTMIAIAGWRVWRLRETIDVRPALGIFILQLLFNFIWTPLFFSAQAFTIAFVDIIILAMLIIATIRMFIDIDALAARLLMPYLLWIVFASYLNGYIAYMN